jgi:hypothetical protein
MDGYTQGHVEQKGRRTISCTLQPRNIHDRGLFIEIQKVEKP